MAFMREMLHQLCDIRSGITLRKSSNSPAESEHGPYLLRIKDISGLEISLNSPQPAPAGERLDKYAITTGDVAFASRGPQCRAGVMPEHDKTYIAPSQLYILTPHDPELLLPSYLALILSSDYAEDYFRTRRKGSRVQIITKSSLSELTITVPPIETQKHLVDLHHLTEQEKQLQLDIITKRKMQLEASIKISQST